MFYSKRYIMKFIIKKDYIVNKMSNEIISQKLNISRMNN